ncbi:acyl carrier protein [Haloactinospora alba]|uniref:Acyl carrier protein n=1 Tax=Haloactinospora alba TaxID=405555 RepID=A0A543NL03_9ACTN|nr:acyl carrier protein [Haloactinospora alba]TQN32482.1 acyl carrier protein [Haloactinospora alba]
MEDTHVHSSHVETWIVTRVAEVLSTSRDRIAEDTPLAESGLSSVQATELTAEIEDRFGISVSPTFIYDHVTPTAIAEEIVARTTTSR